MNKLLRLGVPLVMFALVSVTFALTSTAGASGSPAFSITRLNTPNGDSEPAISIGADGTTAITGLPWLRSSAADFATRLWTGPFGSMPTLQGGIDTGLVKPGSTVVGALDADVDIGSTGRLHATTLLGFVNPPFTSATLGVSAITCPSPASAGFSVSSCTEKIIDTAGADRQWVTSDGARVWISYHDSGNSALIHVQRSTDDGFTWHKVGDPIVGQGGATGNATFNNTAGPIVADPFTHNVYDVYAAGEPGIQKGTTANFNNIFVSRSTNGGVTWTASLVHHEPLNTRLNNVFPSLAVDPTNGSLYAVWTDTHHVFVSTSTDQGSTWSPAEAVSTAPANTTVQPWIAAYNGTVDVVYYGTTASSNLDTSATWFVYMARSTDGGATFSQVQVSPDSNHTGVVCLNGTGCAPGTRNLLDLFEVAIDPANGEAGVIYTDDAHTTDAEGNPLPQIVLAQES
jgi:hypothetical protein